MIRVHCRYLVTFNDSYGPPYLIWYAGTLYLSMTDGHPIPYMEYGNLVTVNDLWSPTPYMECGNLVNGVSPHVWCGNLVTVNDSYGPLIPYMECGNLVMGSPHMYNMMWMWEPCNCQWWEPCNGPLTCTVLLFSGQQWQEPCNRVPPTHTMWFFRMLCKRSTACPNKILVTVWIISHLVATFVFPWNVCQISLGVMDLFMPALA